MIRRTCLLAVLIAVLCCAACSPGGGSLDTISAAEFQTKVDELKYGGLPPHALDNVELVVASNGKMTVDGQPADLQGLSRVIQARCANPMPRDFRLSLPGDLACVHVETILAAIRHGQPSSTESSADPLLPVMFTETDRGEAVGQPILLEIPGPDKELLALDRSELMELELQGAGKVRFDGASVAIESLDARLLAAKQTNPRPVVEITLNPSARFVELLDVLRACDTAAFRRVSLWGDCGLTFIDRDKQIASSLRKVPETLHPLLLQFSEPPMPKHMPSPDYTRVDEGKQREGDVIVLIFVDEAGKVEAVKLLDSTGTRAMEKAALGAARKWEFEPGKLDGVPVKSAIAVPFAFRMRPR